MPNDRSAYFLKDSLSKAIQTFFLRVINEEVGGNVSFVQIGANDGKTHDPLHEAIRHNPWHGLAVEPVPIFFERLKETYRDLPRIKCMQVACAEAPGQLPFYQVRNVDNMPWDGMRGLSSLKRDTIRSHFQDEHSFSEYVEEILIDVRTVNEILVENNIRHVDIAVIDTEGADFRVVEGFNIEKFRPKLLIIEHIHMSKEDEFYLSRRMKFIGYKVIICVMDTIFYLSGLLTKNEENILSSFETKILSLR